MGLIGYDLYIIHVHVHVWREMHRNITTCKQIAWADLQLVRNGQSPRRHKKRQAIITASRQRGTKPPAACKCKVNEYDSKRLIDVYLYFYLCVYIYIYIHLSLSISLSIYIYIYMYIISLYASCIFLESVKAAFLSLVYAEWPHTSSSIVKID